LEVAQFLHRVRTVRIGDHGNHPDIRNKLARKLKSLPTQIYEANPRDGGAAPQFIARAPEGSYASDVAQARRRLADLPR